MSITKALLIYCTILGLIRSAELLYNHLKSEKQNRNNFIGALLYRLIILSFLRFVIGTIAIIFIQWVLSLFEVVTDNNLVYVGIFIMMDLISMLTVKRKDR